MPIRSPLGLARSLLRRSLRRVGYDLVPWAPEPAPEWRADAEEIARLERDLAEFAVRHPGHGVWSNPTDARNYLHHERICFFHEVVKACRRHGVDLDGKRIADVGSGTGYLFRVISASACPAGMTGFDTYEDITALARHLSPDARFENVDFFDTDGERFDVVFATEVLEHLFRPDEALQRLLARTVRGGRVVLTVPDGRADSFPALEPLPNGRGHWGHIHFWSPESWRLFLERECGERRVIRDRLPTGQNCAVIHV